MRHVAACALGWSALLLLRVSAGELPASVAIVLVPESPYSQDSILAMQREAADILRSAGVQPEWRFLSQSPAEFAGDVAIVTLKGRCRMEPVEAAPIEGGPLGWTYFAGAGVIPFGALDCDRVRVSVRSAMSDNDSARAEFVYGRALGRVLAHELYHILRRTPSHGRVGVAQPRFSGRQLISDHLALDPSDVALLRQTRRP